MLVGLVGGITPARADLVFDNLPNAFAAEEQMREHYADAFEPWDRWAAAKSSDDPNTRVICRPNGC
ncbi:MULTISPECIES: hypothetical protein [unclassified Bradyrhizobium]|nr:MULTISPECIES: hypothetical protein [unclassified Bradyrhizobium]